MQKIIDKLLDTLKDSPHIIFSIIVVWIFATVISNKLDIINDTLTKIHTSNTLLVQRMQDEADDTKDFIKAQNDTLYNTNIIIDRLNN